MQYNNILKNNLFIYLQESKSYTSTIHMHIYRSIQLSLDKIILIAENII